MWSSDDRDHTNRSDVGAAARPHPRSAPPHGPDPALRGGGRQADGGRPDARFPASVCRAGGRRGRGDGHARPGRRDHLDPPWPRPRRGQGRGPALHVRRAVRQADRLLQGPRRQHAHQRPEHRHARRERHRGRRHPARRRRGPRRRLQGPGLRGGPVLRRRRDQHRRLPRVGQPGRRHAAARGVRLREQRLRRVHPAGPAHAAEGRGRPGRRLRHARRDRRRHGRRGRLPGRPAAGGAGPGRRGPVDARGQDLPVLRPPGRQGPAHPVPHPGGDRHLEGPGRDHRP